METLSASDTKREFGEILLKAQKEPVGISRNGKPVAVMMPAVEFEELQASKQNALKRELQKGMASLENGNVVESDKVINILRKHIEGA